MGFKPALDVIDELLGSPGAVSGDDCDLLLELRWHLRELSDPETTLKCFCELRRRIEHVHYLSLYKLRRALEAGVLVVVSGAGGSQPVFLPLQLERYCLEAVRRVCLCAALSSGAALNRPRVAFCFQSALPNPEL